MSEPRVGAQRPHPIMASPLTQSEIDELIDRPPLSSYLSERVARSEAKATTAGRGAGLSDQEKGALRNKYREKLVDVLGKHAQLHTLQPGEVLLKEGAFNTSLFILVSGAMEAHQNIATLLPSQPRQKSRSLLARIKASTHFGQSIERRVRTSDHQADHTRGKHYVSIHLDQLPSANHHIRSPDLFGEYGALRRNASPFTLVATEASKVIEVRWQGVRILNKFSRTFKYTLQKNYLSRGFLDQLKKIPLFQSLDRHSIETLKKGIGFDSYGRQNWSGEFAQTEEIDQQSRIEQEPIVVSEGDYVDSLYLILSGFARVTHRLDQHHNTVNYLKGGDLFGLFEAVHNRYQPTPLPYQYSLRAVGYLDLIRIPLSLLSSMALPSQCDQATQRQINASLALQAEALPGYDALCKRITYDQTYLNRQSEQMAFFVEERFINGREAMLINLDRCTGCDDCVRACAINHDNNPRFVRDGKQVNNLLVANACMHCHDPVCLVGCPTGAIQRTESSEVVIDDQACIGCSGCANACPYGNIKMVPVHYPNGHPDLNEQGEIITHKATKCDLCYDSLGTPACVQACPHDALQRVDIKDHALHLYHEVTQ